MLEAMAHLNLVWVGLLVAVGGIYFCYLRTYLNDKYGLNKYPGPWFAKFSRVWLGYTSRYGQRYRIIHHLHLKYGRIVRIAPNELSIADPDAIPIVLGHGNGNTKSKFYDAFVAMHRGLFNTRDRGDHTRKRKIISSTFSQRNVLEFEPYIANILDSFLVKWDKLCASHTCGVSENQEARSEWTAVNCLLWFNYLAFDIIGDLAFGEPFGMVDRGEDVAAVECPDGKVVHLPAVQILNERGEYSMTLGCLPPALRPWMGYIDPWFSRGASSVENLSGMARMKVNKRLGQTYHSRKDLLSRLQEGTDANGNPMGKAELTAEALTQLIAGSDTTSNSACAILWWIVKHPVAHRKLVNELEEKLGDSGSGGVVAYADCKELVYLGACINEALRRHSTSSIGLPRIMADTVKFKGHVLPKGMVCSVPSYDVHHDPEVWGDPWVFRPERWLAPEAKNLERAFMPFSYGPRSCVGRNLATMELYIIISTLFKRYDFRLKDPMKVELDTSEGFLRKPLECWIELKRRSG